MSFKWYFKNQILYGSARVEFVQFWGNCTVRYYSSTWQVPLIIGDLGIGQWISGAIQTAAVYLYTLCSGLLSNVVVLPGSTHAHCSSK